MLNYKLLIFLDLCVPIVMLISLNQIFSLSGAFFFRKSSSLPPINEFHICDLQFYFFSSQSLYFGLDSQCCVSFQSKTSGSQELGFSVKICKSTSQIQYFGKTFYYLTKNKQRSNLCKRFLSGAAFTPTSVHSSPLPSSYCSPLFEASGYLILNDLENSPKTIFISSSIHPSYIFVFTQSVDPLIIASKLSINVLNQIFPVSDSIVPIFTIRNGSFFQRIRLHNSFFCLDDFHPNNYALGLSETGQSLTDMLIFDLWPSLINLSSRELFFRPILEKEPSVCFPVLNPDYKSRNQSINFDQEIVSPFFTYFPSRASTAQNRSDCNRVLFLTNFYAFREGYFHLIQVASDPQLSLTTVFVNFAKKKMTTAFEFLQSSSVKVDATLIPNFLDRLASNLNYFFRNLSLIMDRAFLKDLPISFMCTVFDSEKQFSFKKVILVNSTHIFYVFDSKLQRDKKNISILNLRFTELENSFSGPRMPDTYLRMIVFDFFFYELLQRNLMWKSNLHPMISLTIE